MILDDIDDHPAAYDDPPTHIIADDPDALSRADWHLRKLAALEARKAETARVFNAELERVTARMNAELDRITKAADWHRAPLAQLHAALLAADPTRKTIVLPHGELTSRTPKKPKLLVQDKDAFIEWALVNAPDVLNTTYSVDRTKAAAALVCPGTPEPGETMFAVASGGEVPPGVAYTLEQPAYSIRLDGEW